MVNSFNSLDFDFSIVDPMLIDIKALVSFFSSFSLDFVPRGENLLAHRLARRAVR